MTYLPFYTTNRGDRKGLKYTRTLVGAWG